MDYINVKGRTKNDGYRFLDESENRPLTHNITNRNKPQKSFLERLFNW